MTKKQLKNRKEVKMEKQKECSNNCKEERKKRIVNILYTVVKIVAGILLGQSVQL